MGEGQNECLRKDLGGFVYIDYSWGHRGSLSLYCMCGVYELVYECGNADIGSHLQGPNEAPSILFFYDMVIDVV